MRVSSGRRPGRSHRKRDVPCQDESYIAGLPGDPRIAVAVADGLGTRPQSHVGSETASRAAAQHLASEATWDEAAVRRAFAAAHQAIADQAQEMGLTPSDLATTLQLAG